MPPKTKKTTRKRYRKKGTRRVIKRFKGPTTTVINNIVPDRAYVRLPYTELVELAYTGTLKTYQFLVNSIYDPNYTGAGHQPMGRDQYAQFYAKYIVRGCKYVVTFSNTNPAYQGEVVVQLRPNTTLSATFEDAIEGGSYRRYAVLGAEGTGPTVISGYASCAKLYGVSPKQLVIDDLFSSNIGTSPNAQMALNLYVQNQAVGTALTIVARVQLYYYVELYEKLDLLNS